MSELKLIYEGTDIESQILKSQLAEAGINSLLRSEANDGRIAGFGTFGSSRLFISEIDTKNAMEIVALFKTRNQG
ncbi:DUF2007 domain-containing protein [Roseivirga misakiensis]|uniref:Uncharacterized protein n=1 Tax=Roseivirga misakiensis TaxID=1563681 RepID=A0A1E5T0P7_9BACT|nr:DUF2007 domain-containing protein [Roseivirga misakiensis]OEK04953.1 hypothetical protein BFP71_16105 [Roseivirga misakiensis]